jgi:hypothetical protein
MTSMIQTSQTTGKNVWTVLQEGLQLTQLLQTALSASAQKEITWQRVLP